MSIERKPGRNPRGLSSKTFFLPGEAQAALFWRGLGDSGSQTFGTPMGGVK